MRGMRASVLLSDSPGTERPVCFSGFYISGVLIVHKHNNVNAFGTKQSVRNIIDVCFSCRGFHRAGFYCLCM